MFVVCWLTGLTAWFSSVQKLFFFLFLLEFFWAFRIKSFHLVLLFRSQLWKMPDEQDQFPAIFVLFVRAPRWHAGEPDAIVDGVIELAIAESLGCRRAQIRRFRVKVLPNTRFPAAIVCMTNGAMVRKMDPGIG